MARFGAVTVVIGAEHGSRESSFTSELLSELDAAAQSESAALGAVAWTLARLLVDNHGSAPAFGVIVHADDEYCLLLHGSARALVHTSDGEFELHGSRAKTWIDHVVAEPVERICLTLAADGEVDVDPRSDLRAGLVAGAGLILTPVARTSHDGRATEAMPAVTPGPLPASSTRTVPPPGTASAPETAPPAASPPNDAPGPSAARSTRSLPPIGQASPANPAATPSPEPARPRAGETVAVTLSAGMLVADDGTRIPLDRDYIFGRDPSHEASLTNAATPIVVRDPDNLVSRVQMYLSIHDGSVEVRDAGSANGSFLAAPGATEWTRLTDTPAELREGWSVRLGQRVYTYVGIAP